MLAPLFLVQVMIETLDTRPQAAVPATAFRCTFMRADEATGATSQFDLYGTTPAMPEGHDPNASFAMQLGSGDGSPLAGGASANALDASDWFRDFQVYRLIGGQRHTLNLFLRREGRSVAYLTHYDEAWGQEPYRYDAVGLCAADFSPDTGAAQ